MGYSVGDQFLIAVRAEVLPVNVRRVVLRDSSPAAAVRCIQRAASLVALRERHALVLASVQASAPVPASVDLAPEWVAQAAWFPLQAKRRVHSVRVARSVAAVSNTPRPKKVR